MNIKLEIIALNPQSFVGMNVSTTGRLVVSDACYFAVSYERYKQGECLMLSNCHAVRESLFSALPAYVGGDICYDEYAEIVATVQKTPNGFVFQNVRYLRVVRDDFDMILVGDTSREEV